jgi:hypothetical protein
MARVVWDRRENIQKARNTIKFRERASYENFRPPSQIETDFRRLLDHDVPHINFTFELLHDWYDKEKEGYEPIYIRAQQTPIDWKSKIGNSDMSSNFKTSYEHPIQKGDYVIREDGVLYMLNWNITNHANNQATQSVECNAIVDFTREFQAEIDPQTGFQIGDDFGRRVVVPGIPISHQEYAGRPDFSGSSGQAGMHPDHLISVYCQWNDTTKMLKLEDEFVIGDFTYRIINISLAEVQIDRDHGVLTINAKRVAGGTVSGGS